VEVLMEKLLPEAVENITAAGVIQDSKSRLQEWTQARGYEIPLYRIVLEEGPDHAKRYGVEVLVNDQVLGSGQGASKQAAAKAAAGKALETLGIED
jgi:ribonuclease-3